MTKNNALQQLDEFLKKGSELRAKIVAMVYYSGKVTDRVKTYEDACEEIGEDPLNTKFTTGTLDEIAYRKIKVIAQALNECVSLCYANGDQKKWYPWFIYEGSGFRFCGTDYVLTYSFTAGGSRLCYATRELAEYAGTQFIELYNQLLK